MTAKLDNPGSKLENLFLALLGASTREPAIQEGRAFHQVHDSMGPCYLYDPERGHVTQKGGWFE